MARNVQRRNASTQEGESASEEMGKPQLEGGTSGAPEDPTPQLARVGGPQVIPQRVELQDESDEAPKPKFFKVVQTPGTVMYDGARVNVPHGKIFPAQSVDIERIKLQGVVVCECDANGAEVASA